LKTIPGFGKSGTSRIAAFRAATSLGSAMDGLTP
jgi:hypothetical protein